MINSDTDSDADYMHAPLVLFGTTLWTGIWQANGSEAHSVTLHLVTTSWCNAGYL